MQRYNILWADDEIDLLKPHILFLKDRGYDVTPVTSGADAIEAVEQKPFDLVFLDENMPGMTGLETLSYIKGSRPALPVVMITKNEEEHIMEEAIGAKIADYLIKPLNPNQILISVKKLLDNRRLVSERTNLHYQQDFRNISMKVNDWIDHHEWAEIYKKLVYWELEIEGTENKSMAEVLEMQKVEANANFARFVAENYSEWLNNPEADRPLMSHQLLANKVFPALNDSPAFLIIIDNLRFDQWKIIERDILGYFNLMEETAYYSILPTTTAYARNAIFSGELPLAMSRKYPQLWVHDDDSEEGKNNNEEAFLKENLKKHRLNVKTSYHKIIHANQGKQLNDNFNNLLNNQLNVVVYNFVDMLSHARTDIRMIKELAADEAAYRSLTKSWFLHSPLFDLLRLIADKGLRVMITTDHGTYRVKRPFKIAGDRNVNTNLRYKQGKNLGYHGTDGIFEVRKPEELHLPKPNVSTSYVFATDDTFFAYPNNYNHYVKYYRDTFQHGGVSLEEMIIPFISLISKRA
ncbi:MULTISPECIES: PglZ domain-containing protein [Roseivirga]|jgi:CheY-like chemotaxis protein|uniref:Two-component system response regulator n=1 Tax=Roseivirga thermotolerans TaxID=1758176 RepID=A0ABQ3I3U7_9BACT|nr:MULTISPECIES: PglZ domain-containing protein [Roseivirga]MEC7753214.1 PglZ domain-containing protein [Bacteroidota bacterium]GHE59388.1 two-component system response regulator [Roseivirga thermotolerans]|tara:strand:- start:20042 stop:21604 length:1563 start_codon:yes stop_codon:yes gene_type:complete